MARIGATGENERRLTRDIYAGLSITHTFGVRFKKRNVRNLSVRIKERRGVLAYPIHVNATELSVLIGWPFGTPNIAGLGAARARHLSPDYMIPKTGIVIGGSNFPSLKGRPLAIPPKSLTQHMWVLGPTGSGKSVLLHSMAAQMMEQGMGLVLIEPKGDLANDVLKSVPKHRMEDVIWFDPTDTDRPIGLNVLAGADPERTTGHIVGLFQSLYGDSWGSRLERILRYSVLTAALNGLTLYDVNQLLLNKDFRARIVRQTKDSEARQFWRWLDDSSDTYVDSVVNKLDGFLGSKALRNIIGQQSGLDMEQVVRGRKILLVPLPGAQLGASNAAMLGSLLREMMWDATLRRPIDSREPNVLILDEFQNYADFNTSKSDPFAEARSYGLGLVIANQHTAQLNPHVLASVKANARTKVVFGMEPDDARKLKEELQPADRRGLADPWSVRGRHEPHDGLWDCSSCHWHDESTSDANRLRRSSTRALTTAVRASCSGRGSGDG